MVTFPICKINLGLNIISKRDDGYHDIATAFYPVALCDVLEVVESEEFALTMSGLKVAGDLNDNLVVGAYNLLKKEYNLPSVAIALHKNNPMGAGLGGGSADAAYMLLALNELFNLNLNDTRLVEYAAQLGADCAFFIKSKPCLAYGKGDILEPAAVDLSNYQIVIVKPELFLSTQKLYSLSNPKPWNIPLKEVISKPIEQWRDNLVNDFEQVAYSLYPQLEQVKKELYHQGAIYSAMSGSGSAFYGIFYKDKELNISEIEHNLEALNVKVFLPK